MVFLPIANLGAYLSATPTTNKITLPILLAIPMQHYNQHTTKPMNRNNLSETHTSQPLPGNGEYRPAFFAFVGVPPLSNPQAAAVGCNYPRPIRQLNVQQPAL